jgi:serine/threonine-protein kinase 11
MVIGSPAFQAPEALGDESDAEDGPQKEDIWALGVTLYQSLFLKLPYIGANLWEIVRDIGERDLELPDGVAPEVAVLLRGMLSVDPATRFGVDDLLKNSLIRDAPERAAELPEVVQPKEKEGEIVHVEAVVCHEEYSFAREIDHPRRSSYSWGEDAHGRKGDTSTDGLASARPRGGSLVGTKGFVSVTMDEVSEPDSFK